MSIRRLMRQSLTIQTQGTTTDGYGNAIAAPNGASTTVLGFLDFESSEETNTNRETETTQWKAFLPLGTAIGPLDYLSWGAHVKLQVQGYPNVVFNPRTGQSSHIEVQLIEVT